MKRKLLSTVILGISVCLLTACGAVSGGPSPDTLRINLGTEPPSLDWHLTTDSVSFDVISNIMIGLTQYTSKLTCAPAVAKSWDVLDGGRRYVFHLNPNAKWTDGKPVTAGDFEFAWKRLLNPETAAEYAYFLFDIENAEEYATKKITDASQVGIKAIDDQTFEVRLKRPAAYFINLTAFAPSYPMRKDVVEKFGNRWTEPQNIVTCGPFWLKSWQHEYKIEMESNPAFVDGEPKVKHIKAFMVPEPSTAFALYETDELDYIDNRSFGTPDVERYRTSPEYHNFPLLRNYYLGFNVQKKPFQDARVRLAVTYAIDRKVFPKILRRGETPIYTWIPPALPGYSADNAVSYDPEKAKQLLRDAGYADASSLPPIEFLYANREDVRTTVEVIQDQLKRNLGVKVNLVAMEFKVYLSTLKNDPPPLARATWGADYPDPETFENLFTTNNGNNHTRWHYPPYDKLITEAEGEQNAEKRAKLYAEADNILCKQQAPIAPLYAATQNIMIKPWVHGIAMNQLDFQFFKDVSISSR
jgi:oligopeptide transport system substrate-binding protein